MKIHHYSKETGEYLGSSDARPDPLEDGRFLIPAHASETAPPNTSDNEVAVFSSGAWEVLPDFRGVDYWLACGDKHTIMEIGETVPSEAFLTEPEPPPAPVPTSATPTQEQIDAQRQQAYQAESDPLFFKWQRGQATEQEWLDKIQEIKERFPDVQENT